MPNLEIQRIAEFISPEIQGRHRHSIGNGEVCGFHFLYLLTVAFYGGGDLEKLKFVTSCAFWTTKGP